jgi:hypothetical protein
LAARSSPPSAPSRTCGAPSRSTTSRGRPLFIAVCFTSTFYLYLH